MPPLLLCFALFPSCEEGEECEARNTKKTQEQRDEKCHLFARHRSSGVKFQSALVPCIMRDIFWANRRMKKSFAGALIKLRGSINSHFYVFSASVWWLFVKLFSMRSTREFVTFSRCVAVKRAGCEGIFSIKLFPWSHKLKFCSVVWKERKKLSNHVFISLKKREKMCRDVMCSALVGKLQSDGKSERIVVVVQRWWNPQRAINADGVNYCRDLNLFASRRIVVCLFSRKNNRKVLTRHEVKKTIFMTSRIVHLWFFIFSMLLAMQKKVPSTIDKRRAAPEKN